MHLNNTFEKWEEKTLGELCDVLDSRRKPITKKDRVAGVYPYYGATGILDYVSGWIFDEELVLLGEDGAKWTSGEQSAFKINGKTWVNNHAHVLRPKRDRISDTYLIYNLNFQNLMPYITGTTVPKLNQEKMRSITIPLPPLPEQERIVAKLDKSFEAIDKVKANAEQNLNNAKELFESALNKAFTENTDGWEEKTLYEVLNKVKYTSKIQSKLYKDKGKYPIISQEDVFISGYWDNPSDVYHVKHPIVIFGDHTKVVKYIDFDFVLGADGVKILDPTKDINAKFLYYWTKYVPLRNLGYARHYKLLSEKTIHFPPLPEQERIVEKLDKLQEQTKQLEAIYTKKIKECDELKQSILQKAFRGEL